MSQDVTLTWDGCEYIIPETSLFRALEKVENHLTLHEIVTHSARGSVPMAKLSGAYCELLRHAGARVKEMDVYRVVQSDPVKSSELTQCLLMMLSPPEDLDITGGEDEGKTTAASK